MTEKGAALSIMRRDSASTKYMYFFETEGKWQDHGVGSLSPSFGRCYQLEIDEMGVMKERSTREGDFR
jgi:hypothetical protein